MKNHIATADQIRQAKAALDAERFPPESVKLPKLGLSILLRRLPPEWFLWHGRVPTSLAAIAAKDEAKLPKTPEEMEEVRGYTFQIANAIIVSPKLSLNPRNGEIGLVDIPDEDLAFIIEYGSGVVGPGGADLKAFRGRAEPAAAGADSGHVALPPKRTGRKTS
jgi:hypothetical protein